MTTQNWISIGQIIASMVMAGVGAWGVMALKAIYLRIDKLEKSQDEKIAGVQRVTERHEIEIGTLRDRSVLRTDWIREQSRTNKGLQRVLEGLAEITGRMEITAQVTKAILALAEAIKTEKAA